MAVTIKAGTYTWNETIPQSGWCSGTTVKGVRFNFIAENITSKSGFWYTNVFEEEDTGGWHLSDDSWYGNSLLFYDFSTSSGFTNGASFTVETDQEVTGDDPQGFMDYLTANSDYGSQSEPEQTDTKPIYKRVNGAWTKLTAFERVNGAWVKISSADGGTEEPEQPQEPEIVPYLTFSSPSSFTIGVYNNTKNWNGTLEYSTDCSTWTTWAGTSAISSASDGTKHNLYLRGIGNTNIASSSSNYRWVLTGSNISCTGNIETLLDYATVANGQHPTMANYCYGNMFRGCTSLTTAPQLPATTLGDFCYYSMFYGCTSLTIAPTLPATTLTRYCYFDMFQNCTSLVTAPQLPATTLRDFCYYNMFRGCTSLTTAPQLPATTLKNSCYGYMFYGCTQIKLSTTQTGDYQTPYRIPTSGTGTTATNAFYNMFKNTGGTFTSDPSINTTYYTSNTVV